jgi:hypothetical protein
MLLHEGETAKCQLVKHAWVWLQDEANVMGQCILYLDVAGEHMWVHM